MKKQVLVSVDRGETRVALLEATGTPRRRAKKPATRGAKKDPAAGYRVAELYLERRGNRSIVGNIYKGKVDNVLPGLEAAFVDIGLDKNGFLHVDEIVLPGVEVARRGRGGKEGGTKIADLLKPGQEVVVQVVKDPLKTKGARLSMELTIAGRYMVYAPTGEGVGVSQAPRRQGARAPAQGGQGPRPARRRRDRPHRGPRRQARGLRARAAVPVQAPRGPRASASPRRRRRSWSSRRPTSRCASCATSSPQHFERAIVDDPQQHQRLVSFFTRTAPELVDRVELCEEQGAAVRAPTASRRSSTG